MINFFRKLRRENMNTNYFKYAIGEIFLVVIGILIALSIDNWNENRKEGIQLEGYLKTIEKNIKADTTEINLMQRRYVQFNGYAMDFMRMVFKNEIDERTIGNSMNLLAERYIIIDQSGFESLKSSGAIKDLQGTALEDALFSYYNAYKDARQEEESLNNFIETLEAKLFDMDSKAIVDILRWGLYVDIEDRGEFSLPKQEMLKILATNSYIIGMNQRMADEDSRRYTDMLKQANKVLELIQNELAQ